MLARATAAGGDACPPLALEPEPHLTAAPATAGGDWTCPGGGLTIDASEAARDDGRANGSWNVGAGGFWLDCAGGKAAISGEAGSSAWNMPSPTPALKGVIGWAGDSGRASAGGLLQPSRDVDDAAKLPNPIDWYASTGDWALTVGLTGLLPLAAPITIALRALGLSSPAWDWADGARLSSELAPAELAKLCAGLSRPVPAGAFAFSLELLLLAPTSGESRAHLSAAADALVDGLGRLGTGDGIAGRGDDDGIVGEIRLKTGGTGAGEAIPSSIVDSAAWEGEPAVGVVYSTAEEGEPLGAGEGIAGLPS